MTVKKERQTLSAKAALKILAHALKHPHVPVVGLLVGQRTEDEATITNVIPLFHSLVYPTLPIAVQQTSLFVQDSESILGVYIVPLGTGNPVDKKLVIGPQDTDQVTASIVHSLAPSATRMFFINIKAFVTTNDLSWCIPYHLLLEPEKKKIWKRDESSTLLFKESKEFKDKLEKMIQNRSYSLLIDFDDHLDNREVNWLINPQFTLAHV